MNFRKLLVLIPDPPARHQAALARGLSLAKDFGAEVHLHCIAYNAQLASWTSSPFLIEVEQYLLRTFGEIFVAWRSCFI